MWNTTGICTYRQASQMGTLAWWPRRGSSPGAPASALGKGIGPATSTNNGRRGRINRRTVTARHVQMRRHAEVDAQRMSAVGATQGGLLATSRISQAVVYARRCR
jgi:hypothetical protein